MNTALKLCCCKFRGKKIPLPTDPLEKWRIVCGKRIYFEGWTYICRIIHWLVLFSLYIVLCSDWPAFCRRAHILFALFVFVYLKWCSTHSVLCFLFLCLVYLSYVSGLSIFYCPFGVYQNEKNLEVAKLEGRNKIVNSKCWVITDMIFYNMMLPQLYLYRRLSQTHRLQWMMVCIFRRNRCRCLPLSSQIGMTSTTTKFTSITQNVLFFLLQEIVSADGKPKLKTFRIPSFGQPSVYHEVSNQN